MKDTKKAAKMEENARLEDDCLDQVTGGTGYFLPGAACYPELPDDKAPYKQSFGMWYIRVMDENEMEYHEPSGEPEEQKPFH